MLDGKQEIGITEVGAPEVDLFTYHFQQVSDSTTEKDSKTKKKVDYDICFAVLATIKFRCSIGIR